MRAIKMVRALTDTPCPPGGCLSRRGNRLTIEINVRKLCSATVSAGMFLGSCRHSSYNEGNRGM